MTVLKRLEPDTRPAWSDVTSAGTFTTEAGGRFDRHYHDCDEYWLIFEGRALVEIDDERFLVEPGDIVCTEIGREHDILQVFDRLRGFWFECATVPAGVAGHRHRVPEADAWHKVLGPDDPGPPPRSAP
jgi:mannose-6-phosphate isomerase-like protein (cupin superfamily)